MSGKNLKIDSDNAGRRIDNYLFYIYKGLPKSKVYNMIRKGEIRVNSGRIKPTRKLLEGDEIRIPPYLIDFGSEDAPIMIPQSQIKSFLDSIIYEDDHFIIVNKKVELSVHSGSSNQFGLIDIARAAYPKMEIDLGHRLDKSTSGCILLSKTKKFLKHFHNQLQTDQVTKSYEAILLGSIKKPIRIESNIDISTKEFQHKVQISDSGKKAISEFSLIKALGNFSHVKIIISTGRMHQIRVQSAEMKHPVFNDKKYGDFSLNKLLSKKLKVSRLALHSRSISFEDLYGHKLMFEAPHDTEFDILLSKLGDASIQT